MSQSEIDLTPQEYRHVAGPKRREPILGAGWRAGLMTILGLAIGKAIWFYSMGHWD